MDFATDIHVTITGSSGHAFWGRGGGGGGEEESAVQAREKSVAKTTELVAALRSSLLGNVRHLSVP